ncbi:MAG: hypothetical protein ACQEQV_10765 [Fibrobacterota bacterium]
MSKPDATGPGYHGGIRFESFFGTADAGVYGGEILYEYTAPTFPDENEAYDGHSLKMNFYLGFSVL